MHSVYHLFEKVGLEIDSLVRLYIFRMAKSRKEFIEGPNNSGSDDYVFFYLHQILM